MKRKLVTGLLVAGVGVVTIFSGCGTKTNETVLVEKYIEKEVVTGKYLFV